MTDTTNAGPVLPERPSIRGFCSWDTEYLQNKFDAYGLQCWNACAEQVAGPLREELAQVRSYLKVANEAFSDVAESLGVAPDNEAMLLRVEELRERVKELERDVAAYKAGSNEVAAILSAVREERDRLRAENEALYGFIGQYRRAAIACMNTVIQTRGCDGMDRLSNANDEARELLAARAAREEA